MTSFGSAVLLDDFFAPDSADNGRAVTRTRDDNELREARDIAIANPGKWVRVGQMRWLKKEPSAWASEVRCDQKKTLVGFGGTFDACYWLDDDAGAPPETGQRRWGKALRFVASKMQGPGEGK